MKPPRFKQIISAVLYSIVLFFILWGDDILINWALKVLIVPFFSWFYNLGLVVKILTILFAGSICLIVLYGLFMWLTSVIAMILSYVFQYSKGIYIISFILVALNLITSAINMWAFIQWDFWSVIIWLLIFYFVFHMNWVFIFKRKETYEAEMDKLGI